MQKERICVHEINNEWNGLKFLYFVSFVCSEVRENEVLNDESSADHNEITVLCGDFKIKKDV